MDYASLRSEAPEFIKWQALEALSPGKHVLEYDFKYDGLGAATLAFNSVSGLGRSGPAC